VAAALAVAVVTPAGAGQGGGTPAGESVPAPAQPGPGAYPLGAITLPLTDTSRRLRLPGGRLVSRTLESTVRYPAEGAAPPQGASGSAQANAPPSVSGAPFPLVVFAHGFAVTPAIYSALLDSWARAGYVVVAPVFPLENANAPGGPRESDLVNEPADISFVISQVLAASAGPGLLHGLIDPARIAVAGQSDGGEAALAAACGRRTLDARIRAAMILSGAELSGVGGYAFARCPPLLAVQGTADRVNAPRFTYAYFRAAHRPKYLLRLIGAGHLGPYTRQQPELGVVETASRAFLDNYLKGATSALAGLASLPGWIPRDVLRPLE
jgi:predicted dienelactone hydrolase